MNLKQMRAAALKAAQDIINGAKASARDLTDEEQATVEAKFAEIEDLDAKIAAATKSADLVARLGALPEGEKEQPADREPEQAKSLGEHFVKSVEAKLSGFRGVKGASIAAPEYKASTTTHTIGSVWSDALTTIDTNIVTGVRRRLTIADLLGSGTISGNAITYFVEGALEGDFTTVAEAGAKPQLHYADATAVTDSLKKIAGFIKESDEMIEDLPFLVSAINGRLLYNLALFEEDQLLSGNGTGTNLQGVLNRTGVQTEAAATAVSGADNADAVFRAITKVQTGAGLDADGIAINPADYQKFRLSKDSNGQYFGGGFFSGQYGNGEIAVQPPLWGLRTVVTPAVASGTVVVGAWQQGGSVYRKGGIRVESTNSHDTDFTSNLVTIRAEERVALAVRVPKAFVKVTLDYAAPA